MSDELHSAEYAPDDAEAQDVVVGAEAGAGAGAGSVRAAAGGGRGNNDDDVRRRVRRKKTCGEASTGCNALTFPPREKNLRLIRPPRQRQRWDDPQEPPHVNWGDLFFDLFYVGLAYNLAVLIKNEPSPLGVLYFAGIFGPVMMEWVERMLFDSRFWVDDDPCHRVFEVFVLCMLATAVLHITSVEEMSDLVGEQDMFAFTLSLTLMKLGALVRYVEILIWAEGGPEAKVQAKKGVKINLPSLVFFLAAASYSGAKHFGGGGSGSGSGDGRGGGHDGEHRILAAAEEDAAEAHSKEADHSADYGEVAAAAPAAEAVADNVPIYLCLAGWLVTHVMFALQMLYWDVKRIDHRKHSVPMNIDFAIHRYGEWTMLMLGESILSLIISAPAETELFYVTFYAGILSTIVLQYLHYRSQPHDAEHHALRRSRRSGYLFTVLMQIYSGALVILGSSFKMLLYEYTLDDVGGGGGGHRRRLERASFSPFLLGTNDEEGGAPAGRFLAGGDPPSLSKEDRQHVIGNFYCGSMAVALLCLDWMILTHRGLNVNLRRCRCSDGEDGKISKPGLFLALFRAGLVFFVATLSQYVWRPETVAVVGFVVLLAEVGTRVAGDFVYPDVRVHDEHEGSGGGDDGHGSAGTKKREDRFDDETEERWPNVTHPMPDPGRGGTPEKPEQPKGNDAI